MADHVYKTNKYKAAIYYYFGRLRATEDISLCKDSTAKAQIAVYPQFAPKTLGYIKEQGESYAISVIEKALELDLKYSKREYDPIWPCYHGMSAFNGKPELIPEKDFAEKIAETRADIQKALEKHK